MNVKKLMEALQKEIQRSPEVATWPLFIESQLCMESRSIIYDYKHKVVSILSEDLTKR